MECEKSLELLSEFREGALDEPEQVFVSTHLAECTPCRGVFVDLDLIVSTARTPNDAEAISFPDEQAMWRRLNIEGRRIH